MSDLIDRQAALDAIDAWRREYPLDLQEPIDDCWNSIRELPAVQQDHNADIGKKVEQTGETAQNVQNEDLISRKWLMECIEEGWVKFDTAKDCNRMMHLVRDIAPSAQPATNCSEIPNGSDDTISRQVVTKFLNDWLSCLFENCHKQSASDLKMIIKDFKNMPSAQPEQRWIPCSERLPERADNVIICYKAGNYTLVSTGIYLYKFKMWYVDVVGDLRDGVTAWMPLPEPYKEEDNERA